MVGVHGRGGIAERLELLCQVPGRFHVVDGVGVHARAQVGHGVAGHKLKLGIGGTAAVGAHVELAAAEAVGQVLKVLRALVAGAHVLIDGQVRESLVHDGDDRGLLAVELLLCGGALVALGGVGLVVGLGVLFERGLGIVGRIVGGFGRLDGLRCTNKGRQIALAPVALERAPGVDGDAEGVVVVDEGDVRGHAAQAQHRHEQVGEQHALGVGGTLLAMRRHDAGVLAQQHGDGGKAHGQHAEQRDGEGVAGAGDRGGSGDGRKVTRLDGHGFKRDDEELGNAQDKEGKGQDRGSCAVALEQEEQAGHEHGDDGPLEQDA